MNDTRNIRVQCPAAAQDQCHPRAIIDRRFTYYTRVRFVREFFVNKIVVTTDGQCRGRTRAMNLHRLQARVPPAR